MEMERWRWRDEMEIVLFNASKVQKRLPKIARTRSRTTPYTEILVRYIIFIEITIIMANLNTDIEHLHHQDVLACIHSMSAVSFAKYIISAYSERTSIICARRTKNYREHIRNEQHINQKQKGDETHRHWNEKRFTANAPKLIACKWSFQRKAAWIENLINTLKEWKKFLRSKHLVMNRNTVKFSDICSRQKPEGDVRNLSFELHCDATINSASTTLDVGAAGDGNGGGWCCCPYANSQPRNPCELWPNGAAWLCFVYICHSNNVL